MGLYIFSADDVKEFQIGYIGFTHMRSLFILSHCGERAYNDYRKFVEWCMDSRSRVCPIDTVEFDENVGEDLLILLDHSDCDGELSSSDCRRLSSVLSVDEEAIKKVELYNNNPGYVDGMISLMYDFIDLIEYCAEHEDMCLIFS